MGHAQRERDPRHFLHLARNVELATRPELPTQLAQLREEGGLAADFTDEVAEEFGAIPTSWEIGVAGDGLMIVKLFPYAARFYGMKAWDAAAIAINIDPSNRVLALRTHLYDSIGDVRIEEGALIQDGEVVAFNQEMSAPYPYVTELRLISRQIQDTKGKTGCIFDHKKEEFVMLPSLVQELSGGHSGTILADFFCGIDTGRIDVETVPQLRFGWPLPTQYLQEPIT